MERLETAYLRALQDRASQSTRVSFALSDLPAEGGDTSAVQTLVDTGELYFRLTDDMFDALYPGQFDRRIDGLRIRFPGARRGRYQPHGRLQQISNTRYLTRDRGNGARRPTDRHALQSILIGAPEIDTATLGLAAWQGRIPHGSIAGTARTVTLGPAPPSDAAPPAGERIDLEAI